MVDVTNPIPDNIAQRTGPLIVGYILNCGFHGALCVQVYYYYMAFPRDRVASKILVFGLFLLETIQAALVTHNMIVVFVTGYGNLEALHGVHLQWLSIPIIGITSGAVQLNFAFRIHVFSGSKVAGAIITAVALVQIIAAFIVGVQMSQVEDLRYLHPQVHISSTLWLVGSATCDIIITVCLTYLLSRQKPMFKATQILITKLIRLTIENGSLTAIIAILSIILFLLFPHTDYHVTPSLLLGKSYSFTLVTRFNFRFRIVDGRNDIPTDIISPLRAGGFGLDSNDNPPGRMLSLSPGRHGPAVTLDIEREVWGNDIRTDRSNVNEDISAKGIP